MQGILSKIFGNFLSDVYRTTIVYFVGVDLQLRQECSPAPGAGAGVLPQHNRLATESPICLETLNLSQLRYWPRARQLP